LHSWVNLRTCFFNRFISFSGTHRIQQDLIDQELTVSRRRIGRLMKTEGMQVKTKRKFKATPYSDHDTSPLLSQYK
jgi:transposase InsO family protein